MDAQPQEFRYTLLVRGVETFVLPDAPKGWENSLLNQSRNIDFFGMFRKWTVPMDFVLDGAWILRKEFYKYGLASAVQLVIEKNVPKTWTYQQIYKGDIDFSTFKDNGQLEGYVVTVQLMEAGITAMVTAYKDVVYQVPLNVPEAITINLNGLILKETALFNFDYQGAQHNYYFPGLQLIDNKINSVNQSSFQVPYGQLAGPNFNTVQNYFFQAQVDGQIRINSHNANIDPTPGAGNITGESFIAGGANVVNMGIYNQHGTLLYKIYESAGHSVGARAFSVAVNRTFDVVAGDKLFIYVNGDDDENSINITAGTLYTSYLTISPPTTCLAHRPKYVFDYLMAKMFLNVQPSDELALQTQSFYLDEVWNQLCITSGDAIRPGLTPIYVFPGFNLTTGTTYQVIKGTVIYNGNSYLKNQAFVAQPGVLLYTTPDNGYVQAAPVAADAYYPGDSLTAGFYYQVINGLINYNGRPYPLGSIFYAVPGVDSFTSSDEESGYVIQTTRDLSIKTSFTDFFKSYNGAINIGFGVENDVAVLEEKAYFFKDTLPVVDLGDVKDVELEVYTEFIANKIKTGYPDQTYDIIDGIDEYNSEQNYVSPIVRVQRELDISSKYRGDMYGTEFLRIQAGANQARKGDSEVFFLKVQANPVTNEFTGQKTYNTEGVEAFTSVSGTTAGTSAFNLDITPKRNLLRHGNYLHSMLDKYDGYQITFASALKSASLVTINPDGSQVSEIAPIEISSLGPKMFLPYLVTVKTKLPQNALMAIDGAPTGFVKYTEDGNQYTGFLMDCSVDVAKNKEQTWKLLLCAGNNLDNRIH